VKVPGLSQVTSVATNAGGCCTSFIGFSLALTASGTVMAWGDNHFGELGNGGTTSSTTPVAVQGLTGASAIAAGGLQGIALTAGTSPAPSPRSGPFSSIWRQTANPRNSNEPGGLKDTFLESVSAASSTDAWAVGFHSLASTQPLAEHFNGHTWQSVPAPAAGTPGIGTVPILNGVSADSPNDAWAVGGTTLKPKNPDLSQDTLTLHWDGNSWQAVPSPCLTGLGTVDQQGSCNTTKASNQEQNHLTGVTALSPDNVWASGYENGANGTVPYVLHWDGTRQPGR
jgi:hypothetical protein